MSEITVKRISEILRLVFDLLWFEPEGLYASEIMHYVRTKVPLSTFEAGFDHYAPYAPRYEVIIRVGTIPLVRAGWLEKNKNGRWLITEAGREACLRYKNSEDFFEESIRLFQEWKAAQNHQLAQISANPVSRAQEYSWEQIRQYIDSIDMDELRGCVGALLKAIGCHVVWVKSKNKKETNVSVDLICYLNPLGLNSSRVMVHIANKTQPSTVEGLSSVMRALGPGELGLYISFGGLTSTLKDFALTQTQNQIRLIDLETFIDLWVENQNKIELEYRMKFPLKPVYFLSFPEAT
jgi:hypothetical protein